MNLASTWVVVLLFFICISIDTCYGEEDTLGAQEKQLVAQLRPLVSSFLYMDYMNKDEYLARFLRVRNNDVNRARDLIKEAMEWRKKNKMDTILAEDFGIVEKMYPIVFEGVDNYGRPLAICNIGVLDVRKLVISGQLDGFLRLFTAILELIEAVAREVQAEPGRSNVTRAYLILDLGGFNLRQHWCAQCIQLMPYVFNVYENYYPDRIYKLVSVNTPRAFLPIFELTRPFFSSPTRKSVHLLDYNTENWKKFLRSDIPDDQLPVQYGGIRHVQPKTLSYLKKHDKYVKAALEKTKMGLEPQPPKDKDKAINPNPSKQTNDTDNDAGEGKTNSSTSTGTGHD